MPSRKKIFYIVSHVYKSLAFEWTAQGLRDNYDLTFVLLNPSNSTLENFLKANGIPVVRIKYRGKADLPLAFIRLCWLFLKERPEIVHTHLFDATLIGLTAAWVTRIKKRIYTRHNSTFHHLYFPKSVKYDLWSNRLSTHIVSISQATDKVLLEIENAPLHKLRRIPHGFDLNSFVFVEAGRVLTVKEKWKVPDRGPRIGVVARHIEWKGVQYIIPAFQEFLKSYPEACLILANASGPYQETILGLLRDIPKKNVVLIPFEEDISALYKLFDLYVHTPIDSTCEAFGQTYIEALASGVPSVFSLSGIASEFIINKKNALVVGYRDSSSIHRLLITLWESEELKKLLIENGRQSVFACFEIEFMHNSLKTLYEQ